MLIGRFSGISEAHYHHRDDTPPPSQKDEDHSDCEVSTAAIVGAVLGAVIAKATYF